MWGSQTDLGGREVYLPHTLWRYLLHGMVMFSNRCGLKTWYILTIIVCLSREPGEKIKNFSLFSSKWINREQGQVTCLGNVAKTSIVQNRKPHSPFTYQCIQIWISDQSAKSCESRWPGIVLLSKYKCIHISRPLPWRDKWYYPRQKRNWISAELLGQPLNITRTLQKFGLIKIKSYVLTLNKNSLSQNYSHDLSYIKNNAV